MSDLNNNSLPFSSQPFSPKPTIKIFNNSTLVILKNSWQLPSHIFAYIKGEATFIMKASIFLDHIEQECYPLSHEDSFLFEENRYFIFYRNSSGAFLEDLCADMPDIEIAIRLRKIHTEPILYRSVVRIIHDANYKNTLIKEGAIEL